LTEQTVWDAFPYQPSLLLKMSYYTAPNELALFPLRLNVSLYAKGVIDDAEFQHMVRRDIGDILTRAPALKPALVAAYRSALPEGKVFAERVSEIDPSISASYAPDIRERLQSARGTRPPLQSHTDSIKS
jgi:hypothetical protein